MLTSRRLVSFIYIYALRQYNILQCLLGMILFFSNCKSKSVPVVVVFVTNEIVNVSNIVNCVL